MRFVHNPHLNWILPLLLFAYGCTSSQSNRSNLLKAELNSREGNISVYRLGDSDPIVVQNARPDFRPYLHPIQSPDGLGPVTEYSPGHHKHQTGLYWGFTRVNGQPIPKDSVNKWFYRKDKTEAQKGLIGRDFFHNPGEGYWKRLKLELLDSIGESVRWRTVYHMLGEDGEAILEEMQEWTFTQHNDHFYLDLEWKGKALTQVTIGEHQYGGLFLRMPWKEGIKGQAVNFARQVNERAEGQKSLWVDVGMQLEGRDDLAHVAIFDHPDNSGFPHTWRVDRQLGVGPSRARMGDWKILKGETETIKHRLVVYTGELNDLELTEQWKEYVGNDNIYATAALWNVAQEEGRVAKFLTAEESVEEMTIKEGFQVNAYASEPMITQPMAFCWDDRGRMWIAENRDYESRRDGFSGSGDSRILIIEDTDRDGKADSRKVFIEGIAFPAAIAVGFGGVFVGAPPNLLFIPDKDGDDEGDEDEIEVLLTGWGIRDRHETINSLHWGPDGWLYGLEGFATASKIRKPIGDGKIYRHNDAFPEDLLEADGVDINGGVWRYHPTKKIFEAVAHGFSNPWGIDYDAMGQLFISACVIPHIFHVIPGGIYHRQGGQHFSPYVYEDIQTIVDHRHRSAHGGARFYLSDAFPESERGRLFMANIHEHAVLSDVMEPKGSGFVAHHGDDFMLANNAQWIGFSMEIGPEGGMYVLDWHDADICGQEVLHKETGRVFRITPTISQAENWEGRYSDLNDFSDLELAKLQESKSVWHARRARVILQYRAHTGSIDDEAIDYLERTYADHESLEYRLRAMWGLNLVGGLSKSSLVEALKDKEEYVRSWAIQLLCEDKDAAEEAIEQFEKLAASDPSPVVRLYLAAALQRIPIQHRWTIGRHLMDHEEDQTDHNIPKMIWFGMEPAIASDIDRGLELALESKIPALSTYIARRSVDANALPKLIELTQKESSNQLNLLSGLQAELESRSDLKAPPEWESAYVKLRANQKTRDIAREIAQQFGDLEAAGELMSLLHDENSTVEQKRSAINGLAGRQWPALKSLLPKLIRDPDLGIEAIRAIAQYDDNLLGRQLYRNYFNLEQAQKTEAIQTMASRRTYANILVDGIKNDKIPRSDVPAYVARQLRRVMGNGFVEVWGPIDDINADIDAQYLKYKELLSDNALSAANTLNGKSIYQRTCSACHKMFGEGGNIGPDITGSNRTNLDYLLTNILEPNAEVIDEYRMVIVTMRDGRTHIGNIASENDRQMVINVVGQDALVINKSEVQSREDTPNSMMPTGLLNTLSDQEVIDLTAYLMHLEGL